MKYTALEVYEKLVNEYNIIGEKAIISFDLKGLKIEVESKDSVGNLLQDWLKAWMISAGVDLIPVPNSQDFPDFQLDADNPQNGLLEVKVFNYLGRPGFDVANFLSYRKSLLEHPYRLDSQYLILGYEMRRHEIEIKNIWLKKVWEITGPSNDWALNCQVKYGELVNIRPVKWYENNRTTFKPFNNPYEFIKAFDSNQRQWTRTQRDPITNTWLNKVIKGYKACTGIDLAEL